MDISAVIKILSLIFLYLITAVIFYLIGATYKKYVKFPFVQAFTITMMIGVFGFQMYTFFYFVCPLFNINPREAMMIDESSLLIKLAFWMTAMPLGLFGFQVVTGILKKKDGIYNDQVESSPESEKWD